MVMKETLIFLPVFEPFPSLDVLASCPEGFQKPSLSTNPTNTQKVRMFKQSLVIGIDLWCNIYCLCTYLSSFCLREFKDAM